MALSWTDAAAIYLKRHWLPIPLTRDANGFPKVPIPLAWSSLARIDSVVMGLPWHQALGMGIVLGQQSDNLCVLDIDDVDLAEDAFAVCTSETRCVRTIRGRGHIYYVEDQPSRSTVRTVQFNGHPVKVELKAQGTQVAAPPTPGYALLSKLPPQHVTSVAAAWAALAVRIGIDEQEAESEERFPPAWRDAVPKDERNKTAYIEAHRLRESGMPLGQALRYIQLRWEQDYAPGEQEWREIEATVRSAYRKGERKQITRDTTEHSLWR